MTRRDWLSALGLAMVIAILVIGATETHSKHSSQKPVPASVSYQTTREPCIITTMDGELCGQQAVSWCSMDDASMDNSTLQTCIDVEKEMR